MCLCVTGLRAKLKVQLRNWGPVVETPFREVGISRESGKNIPMVINQNFGDTNDQKQRDRSPPVSLCHLRPTAMSHPPVLLPHRPSLYAAHRDWPNGPRANRDPIEANWIFVIAQSVVALGENETWKRYNGGKGKSGRSKRGDRFFGGSKRQMLFLGPL